MRLALHSSDFEENTITFLVPEPVMLDMGFYPCELEIGIEELMKHKPAPSADAREVEDDGVVHNLRGRWMTAEDIAAHDAALLKKERERILEAIGNLRPSERTWDNLETAIEGRKE